MTHLKTTKLAAPQNDFDLTKVIEWTLGIGGFLIAYFKWVDTYFKHKRDEKEEFIEKVVRATMDSCLKEFKSDFHEFKTRTESKMDEFNKTVTQIYAEVRK